MPVLWVLSWEYMMQRSADGKTYYTFEFLAKAPNYTRHALGTVSIKDGIWTSVPHQ
jgi:hypothetical protein